jgi:hypothetical protein
MIVLQKRALLSARIGEHRHASHVLKASGDNEVVLTTLDAAGREVDCLLPGATKTVDSGRRYRDRPPSGEHARAPHTPALLKGLRYASYKNIFDPLRLNIISFD